MDWGGSSHDLGLAVSAQSEPLLIDLLREEENHLVFILRSPIPSIGGGF